MHVATRASYAVRGALYWPGDICCSVSGIRVLGEAYELLLQWCVCVGSSLYEHLLVAHAHELGKCLAVVPTKCHDFHL